MSFVLFTMKSPGSALGVDAAIAPVESACDQASDGDDVLGNSAAAAWSWRLMWLGIAVRVVRYLCVFPIWQDEQLLALNLIERDYAGLLEPLGMFQVAPVGFLLLTKLLVETFGLGECSLRAVSLAASLGGLVAFRALAARLLTGTPLVLAVGTLAVSFFPVRHAAEFKPYAVDFCAATLLALAAVDWFREPHRLRRWLILGAVCVAALPFSFPATFVVAAIGLAMLPHVWANRRSPQTVLRYLVFGGATATAFLGLYRLNVGNQYDAATATSFMHDYWSGGFPPSWREAWRWPLWLLEVHTGEGLAYPFGSKRFGSTLSAIAAAAGIVALYRRGCRDYLRLAACVGGLGLLAAALGRYPYGHGERLQQHWIPFVCLFIGVGAASGIERIRSAAGRRRVVQACLFATVVAGVLLGVYSHVRPYKHRWDREHQLFSRWFWRFASGNVPQLCINDDLGWHFVQKDEQKSYLVQREIYRRSPITGARFEPSQVAPGTTIDCVAFSLEGRLHNDRLFAKWMATMQRHYRLVERRVYPIRIDDKPGKNAEYSVWRFEPLTATTSPADVVRTEAFRADDFAMTESLKAEHREAATARRDEHRETGGERR